MSNEFVEPPLEISLDATVAALAGENAPFFLDCRTPREWEFARIPGAQLVPMQELPARLEELEAYRESHVIIHCHHGGRSLQVAQWLRQQGFARAQSMEGGIEAWSLSIDPSVPRY